MTHPFASPSLRVRDEDGREICTCGRARDLHREDRPALPGWLAETIEQAERDWAELPAWGRPVQGRP